jgi:hypothetical protein
MTTSEVIARDIKMAWIQQENFLIHSFQLLQCYQEFNQAYVKAAELIFLNLWDMYAMFPVVPPVLCTSK